MGSGEASQRAFIAISALLFAGSAAATIVWCATSPQLDGKGGVFCENVDIAPISSGDPRNLSADAQKTDRGVVPWAIDRAAARRLWDLSEKLTNCFAASQS